MRRELVALAALAATAAGCAPRGERVQTVPEAEVSATVLRLATDALALCPKPQDADAEALIRRARKAGWPRFVENAWPEDFPVPEPKRERAPTDVDRIARWIVRAEAPADAQGRVDLIFGQNARIPDMSPDFKPITEQVACVMTVLPRSSGPDGLRAPGEFETLVNAVSRHAGGPPTIRRQSPSIGANRQERTAVWSYALEGGRWVPQDAEADFQASRTGAPVQRRRTLNVSENHVGFIVGVSNYTR